MQSTPLDAVLEATAEGRSTVVLAGAGGGYDVFSGLPLYHALREAGRTVVLANLTFTWSFNPAAQKQCEELVPDALWSVVAPGGTRSERGPYFPELYLSEFLGGVKVYILGRTGVVPLTAAYEKLVALAGGDAVGAIVLVDGGTDSLCLGDEPSMGSPEEDVASLTCVHALRCGATRKFLFAVGWGVDAHHGVCHNLVLENIARLTASNGVLGVSMLLPHQAEFALYKQACEYAFSRMQVSIVAGSVLAAAQGQFGHVNFTERVRSGLFINPLMAIYWGFRLEVLAQHHLFINDANMARTMTSNDVYDYLTFKRAKMTLRKDTPFPH